MVVLMLLWPGNGIVEVCFYYYSSTNIKRLLFLLVLAVLLNVLSRVYCNNDKLIIKVPNKDFRTEANKLVFPNVC